MFLIKLTEGHESSVWHILRCKWVNVVCEIFFGTDFVDRELMRGTNDGVLDLKGEM